MQILKARHHYSHAGEYFSKILLMQATLYAKGGFLHIVMNQKEQKKYKTLADQFVIPYHPLTSLHDIGVLEGNNKIIYSIVIDLIDQDISNSLLQSSITISTGQEYEMQHLMKQLQDIGYEFHEYKKPGSYMRTGDSIHIYYPEGGNITLSYWGDEVESIISNNEQTHNQIKITNITEFFSDERNNTSLIKILEDKKIMSVIDSLQFHHLYEFLLQSDLKWVSLNILSNMSESGNSLSLGIKSIHIDSIEDLKKTLAASNSQSVVYTRHIKTIEEFLQSNNFGHIQIHKVQTHLLSSFSYQNNKISQNYICDDILGKIFIKKRIKKNLSAEIDLLLKIQNGDYIVHIDHGIGLFKGIIKKQIGTIVKEYLEIQYKENDKLYVPITEVHRVSKYIGNENPQLTPLSGKIWQHKMQKVHEDIREIAEGILQNFAERKLRSGEASIIDKNKLAIFQESFPYSYTQDQENAIREIHEDMEDEKNMDRLLVGDVGFGKTEVAFNAAFVALSNNKQVLLISPLVVLAHEHYEKTLKRFELLPYKIEVLTRLQSQRHATQVLKGLANGTIDMVVGTHRLLSDTLVCKSLGLMIVDEEHKFGVTDKEKIKNIKSDIDILSLSATPIPRSLNLALSGVRSISLLKTPPRGRKSIETSVLRFNETLIQDAGKREFKRGGQIFFVHNRVATIEVIRKKLEALFPKRNVIITHGQLPGDELENRILDFKHKKYDILLSTTVIENGIDFANVNTIFINECQQFGISQIHQLRGRVGRSDVQGYCYLLYKREHLDDEAAKRIQTIVDYSYLGAGFELAMKDLEIRGGGDILGIRQSGQAKEIGVSLFLKMLEEKIFELKQQKSIKTDNSSSEKNRKPIKIDTKIDLMISAGIPDEYFLSETDKINFYREIEGVQNREDLEFLKQSFFENITDTKIPDTTQNLFELLECQIYCKHHMIESIKRVGANYQIQFDTRTDIETLKTFLKLDSEVVCSVVDVHRVRTAVKGFANDGIFIKYLLRLFAGKIGNPKIKLVRK